MQLHIIGPRSNTVILVLDPTRSGIFLGEDLMAVDPDDPSYHLLKIARKRAARPGDRSDNLFIGTNIEDEDQRVLDFVAGLVAMGLPIKPVMEAPVKLISQGKPFTRDVHGTRMKKMRTYLSRALNGGGEGALRMLAQKVLDSSCKVQLVAAA